MMFTATQPPIEGTLPSLAGAIEWLNTQPLTMTQLRGKVVLVEFWTYTCINWRRTLPYVRAWAEKYRDQVDVRAFGTGERIVFLPYTREVFTQTQQWIEAHRLFDGVTGQAGYDEAVLA